MESALKYDYGGGASSVQWTTRYGFEAANSASDRQTVFRSGLGVSQVFSPRLQATANLSYYHTDLTTIGGAASSSETGIDASLGGAYSITPHLSVFANYTFTDLMSSQQFVSYYRNRIYIGATFSY
jgi:hypothetical protein